jgi:hypothetical protein
MFHQGVYHNGGPNEMDFDRHIIHMVYAPPWLIRSDRTKNSPEFLARTTALRRSLMGEWEFPEQPFGGDIRSCPLTTFDDSGDRGPARLGRKPGERRLLPLWAGQNVTGCPEIRAAALARERTADL